MILEILLNILVIFILITIIIYANYNKNENFSICFNKNVCLLIAHPGKYFLQFKSL